MRTEKGSTPFGSKSPCCDVKSPAFVLARRDRDVREIVVRPGNDPVVRDDLDQLVDPAPAMSLLLGESLGLRDVADIEFGKITIEQMMQKGLANILNGRGLGDGTANGDARLSTLRGTQFEQKLMNGQQVRLASTAQPDDALHIGDSFRADVVGAKSAGIEALWLVRPATRAAFEEDNIILDKHPNVRKIESLAEVMTFLGMRERAEG